MSQRISDNVTDSRPARRTPYVETFNAGNGGWFAWEPAAEMPSPSDESTVIPLIRDGVYITESPWWVDSNHAPPGAGYVHLLAFLQTNPTHPPAFGWPNTFIEKGYSTDLRDARMTLRLRGNVNLHGAELLLLAQATVPGGTANLVLTGQPFTVAPDWSDQSVTLTTDPAQWTCLGARHDLVGYYCCSEPADVLRDVNVNLILVQFPLEDRSHRTGRRHPPGPTASPRHPALRALGQPAARPGLRGQLALPAEGPDRIRHHPDRLPGRLAVTGAAPRACDAAEVSYRLAELADIEPTYRVFIDVAKDLNRKNGRAAQAGGGSPQARAMSFRRSMLCNDAQRYWLAEAGRRIVGFAMATMREDVWYLAALHVLPEYQAHGVGRELLRRSSTGATASTVRTVLSDTINPISNGLYMKTGMLHQDAILTFDGRLPGGPSAASSTPLEDAQIRPARGPDCRDRPRPCRSRVRPGGRSPVLERHRRPGRSGAAARRRVRGLRLRIGGGAPRSDCRRPPS